MSEIMFSSESMSKEYFFQQLKIHEYQKAHFPCKKKTTEAILAAELWDKS